MCPPPHSLQLLYINKKGLSADIRKDHYILYWNPRQVVLRYAYAPTIYGNIFSFNNKKYYTRLNLLSQYYSKTFVGLTLTPGPIVAESETDLTYCPFAADGLAFITASINVWKLSANFSTPNEAFPIGQ